MHSFNIDVKLKRLACAFYRYQYLRMTKLTRSYPFVRAGHMIIMSNPVRHNRSTLSDRTSKKLQHSSDATPGRARQPMETAVPEIRAMKTLVANGWVNEWLHSVYGPHRLLLEPSPLLEWQLIIPDTNSGCSQSRKRDFGNRRSVIRGN